MGSRVASRNGWAIRAAGERKGCRVNGVIDDGFLNRYRELLDAESTAFDELEHAVEDGDREHYELDFASWKETVARRSAFLERYDLTSFTATAAP